MYWNEYYTSTKSTENSFIFNTLAQYNIMNWGKNKQFSSHIGLSISPQYTRRNWEGFERNTITGEYKEVSGKYNELKMWPGVNHTLNYNVNKVIQLSLHTFFRYNDDENISPVLSYFINSQLGCEIGAAYRF